MDSMTGSTVHRVRGLGPIRLIGSLLAALFLVLLAIQAPAAAQNAANPEPPFFVTPVNGQTLEGTVTVMVYAPLHSRHAAELGVDNAGWQPMSTDGSGVFITKLNTAYYGNGKHSLTARFSVLPGDPPVAAVFIQVFVQNDFPDGQALREGQRLADSGAPVPCFGNSYGKGGCIELPGPGPDEAALQEGLPLADTGEPVPCYSNSYGKGGCIELPGPGPDGAAGNEVSRNLLPYEDGKPGIGATG